jgi:pimeloyl-ACP methyl ester carboxylesterase
VEPVIQDILATDGNARAGLAASIKPGGYQDEVEIVASLDRPLMVIHGEHEQIANVEYIAGLDMPTLWGNDVQLISGAGHSPHLEQPERFNQLLESFLADI